MKGTGIRNLLMLSLIGIVFLAGCASYTSQPSTSTETGVNPTGVKHEVEITSAGFSPEQLNIGLGDTLVFVNKDAAQHWPASAVHPTHCEYKGCGVFDAKRGLSQGESYTVVFDLAGNWKYHDHLNPGTTGTVVVQ